MRATACLCGAVTFAPAKPSASRPRTASCKRSGSTSSATYVQSRPRAANAAFCMRGESECETGWPRSATTRVTTHPLFVAVRDLVVDEVLEARREVVVHPVRLAHEIQVIDARGVRRRLHRREPR